jgi:hypothetical protein
VLGSSLHGTSSAKFEIQVPLHRWPFRRDYRENHGIADTAIGIQLVAAQNAILLRAQPFDGAAARMVEEARSKLDRDASEQIESMGEQHKFAFGIDQCALSGFCIPRGPDLDSTVCGVNVHESRHTDDLASYVAAYCPGQHRARLLKAKPSGYFSGHDFWRRNRRVPEVPQFPIADGFNQAVMMALRQRFQGGMASGQSDGFSERIHGQGRLAFQGEIATLTVGGFTVASLAD